jgi:hypothetical protein
VSADDGRLMHHTKGHTMRSILLTATAALLVAVPAAAQWPAPLRDAYVSVNLGGQAQSQEFPVRGGFPLYGEDVSFDARHDVRGGGLFDIGGGVRVWESLSVGLTFATRFKDTRDSAVTAQVPSPIFTDTFRATSGTASGLRHRERAVHLHALWRVPVTEEFDVSLSLGPSFFTVRRDVLDTVQVAEVGGDFSAATISGIATQQVRDSGAGVNVGVDGTYMFTRQFGGGVQLRYARGSVTLPVSGSSVKLDAGGFEFGAGLRVRF